MARVKWNLCSETLPEKDGEYLKVAMYEDVDGNQSFGNITVLNFVAGEDGGWNCIRLSNGKIFNENRIENVYAWADIKSLISDLKGGKR